MSEAPALKVDWESGEGRVEIGERLRNAPARLRYDVLADWKDEIESLLRDAETQLHPEKRHLQVHYQRANNLRRRALCERLSGHTIEMAEPLVNGDVLLHLRSGRSVVLYAFHEDIKLDVVNDVRHARRYAAQSNTGDYYLREEPPEAGPRNRVSHEAP
jgi:hypothetical protein